MCSTGVEMRGWPRIVGGQRHSLKNEIIAVLWHRYSAVLGRAASMGLLERDLLKRADTKRLLKCV